MLGAGAKFYLCLFKNLSAGFQLVCSLSCLVALCMGSVYEALSLGTGLVDKCPGLLLGLGNLGLRLLADAL